MAKKKERSKGRSLLLGFVLTLLVLVLAAIVVGGYYFKQHYMMVGGKIYENTVTEIDLRDTDYTVEQFEELRTEHPDIHFYWNVPIGGSSYDCMSKSITVGNFDASELSRFDYFEALGSVTSSGDNWDTLMALREKYPELTVSFNVELAGNTYPDTAEEIAAAVPVSYDELSRKLTYFENLSFADITNAGIAESEADLLTEQFPAVSFRRIINLCGKDYLTDTDAITVGSPTAENIEELLAKAHSFTNVQSIDFGNAYMDADTVIAVREAYGNALVYCNLSFFGINTYSTAQEIDFSNIQMTDTAEAEKAIRCMGCLEKVYMCDCGISNEEMDALNKKFDNVRVIWNIYVTSSYYPQGFVCRTDAVDFCVSRVTSHYGDIVDKDVEALKYCTDLVTLDLGHMYFTNIDFVANMPHLRFFIIGDTLVTDISPLANCKELFYIEMFLTPVADLSPLYDIPALKHINISYDTNVPYEQLMNFTEADRVWAVGMNYNQAQRDEILNAGINATFFTADPSSVSQVWRNNPSYFEMRDNLGMMYHV